MKTKTIAILVLILSLLALVTSLTSCAGITFKPVITLHQAVSYQEQVDDLQSFGLLNEQEAADIDKLITSLANGKASISTMTAALRVAKSLEEKVKTKDYGPEVQSILDLINKAT